MTFLLIKTKHNVAKTSSCVMCI